LEQKIDKIIYAQLG